MTSEGLGVSEAYVFGGLVGVRGQGSGLLGKGLGVRGHISLSFCPFGLIFWELLF